MINAEQARKVAKNSIHFRRKNRIEETINNIGKEIQKCANQGLDNVDVQIDNDIKQDVKNVLIANGYGLGDIVDLDGKTSVRILW